MALQSSMNGRAPRKRGHVVDCRSLMVECPEHRGLLLPVTDVRIAYNRTSDQVGKRGKEFMVIDLEALCVYCNNYKNVQVREGSVTRFSDDEQMLLTAVTALVARCPGMLFDEVIDTMTAAGGSRAALAVVIHMGIKASVPGIRIVDDKLYPESLAGPTALSAVV